MLRSGTAVGTLVSEAIFAQSGPDFLNKMYIALKEANETKYWLDLLKDTEYIEEVQYDSISNDCKELVALLVSIVKSMKVTLKKYFLIFNSQFLI